MGQRHVVSILAVAKHRCHVMRSTVSTGCQWYAYTTGIAGLNTINCLTCIAIDRYLVIRRRRTRRRTAVMVGASLIWALVWATPPMIGWSQYTGEGFMASEGLPFRKKRCL